MSLSNQTATELLEQLAERGCHFVQDGDPPDCKTEWPDSTRYWCTSCFATLILEREPQEVKTIAPWPHAWWEREDLKPGDLIQLAGEDAVWRIVSIGPHAAELEEA